MGFSSRFVTADERQGLVPGILTGLLAKRREVKQLMARVADTDPGLANIYDLKQKVK